MIVGGDVKGVDLDVLKFYLNDKVKVFICFGKDVKVLVLLIEKGYLIMNMYEVV